MGGARHLFELDKDELDTKLSQARQELFNLRFQLATGRLDNVSRIRQVRKEIARILTVIRQNELSHLSEGQEV
ncbi:MAG: 50S ribosomal protein L29 [Actinobacteria bacterium]|jgi:large subunit ribosomal protein L29|nr:50S ribosomal protein L29 [Actinomycetota bacterium]MCL6095796.1 50S ribosomal protein L29 [Actinomycetota bacterium]